MIKYVQVSGFKSLSDFRMDLKSGLNILVGPNGSGKTNIISFFEFLGLMLNMNIADAINEAGGAGSIFRKLGENEYESSIQAKIVGTSRITSRNYLFYCYEFTLNIHESGETIYYSRQRLRIKFRTVNSIDSRRIRSYDLDIEKNINKDLKSAVRLNACNVELAELLFSRRRKLQDAEIRERIKHYFSNYVSSDECIVNAVRLILRKSWDDIIKDFSGGNIYNIEPSKTKTPDDSAKKPGLSKDGSGLYATLYAIKKRQELYRESPILRFIEDNVEIGDTSLSDILSFTRLANEWIEDIEILNNPFDKQLQIRVNVLGDNRVTVLPLSAMSDGTVKWIALITIIMTNKTIFSIEEPENYLHPLMLREIMSIMRAYVYKERFVLISTHSETLINNASPDEIVVCNYKNGKTIAKRVSNAEALDREIRDTGFGLGYLYMSGSIEYE